MSWKKVSLSECCFSVADGDHFPPPKAESGIPFVTIANIDSSNHFDFSNTMFVPQEYYDALDSKRRAQKGDVLYSVVGSFGIPVLMKDDVPFVFQRHIAILRPNPDILDSRFLYYTMLSRDFYAKADAVALGAAQRTISLTSLRKMEIAIPELSIQRRIADILSAYDNLIENNQRQIKLLEEAAQRLYKEWFVDLYFPGCENTPIVDGVPEGWEWTQLSEIAKFQRGKTITKIEIADGTVPVVAGGLEPAYYTDKSFTASRVITVSGSGANAGFTRMYYEKIWASDCSYVDSLMTDYLSFVYCFLCNNKTAIDNLQKGSAQPHVYAKDINSLPLLKANSEMLEKFEEAVSQFFTKVAQCNRIIKSAKEARNRLLPKLMNGEIKV